MKSCIGKRCDLANRQGLRFTVADSSLLVAPNQSCLTQAFAVEYADRVYAYKNHCPHLGIELDWTPGVFFDEAGETLVCSTHGARFEPDTGRCISGPCAGQSLEPVAVFEHQGELYAQRDPSLP